MSLQPGYLEKFQDYIVAYPEEDEPGYDGVHDGGIKCLRDDAPESAKDAYKEFQKLMEEAKKSGLKI